MVVDVTIDKKRKYKVGNGEVLANRENKVIFEQGYKETVDVVVQMFKQYGV